MRKPGLLTGTSLLINRAVHRPVSSTGKCILSPMDIATQFTLRLPPTEAFSLLTDLERVAPAMPGVELLEAGDDEVRATMKVKVGPVRAEYSMRVSLASQDPSALTAVLHARGRELRGQGTVDAVVTAALSGGGDATVVSLNTAASVTGRVAQFGSGVMHEVAERMLREFADQIERDMSEPVRPGVAQDASHP
jgi:uncharacterized protein